MKTMCDPEHTTFSELIVGDVFKWPDGIDHHIKISALQAKHDRLEGGRIFKCVQTHPVVKIGHSADTE